jgi:hypothetical protein
MMIEIKKYYLLLSYYYDYAGYYNAKLSYSMPLNR